MSDAMDESDVFLQQLKDIAEGNQEDAPPPAKKAKVSELRQVITKQPVMLSGAQASEFMESMNHQTYITPVVMSEKHSLAPMIPVVSEVPLPAGYGPNREVSEGITAGRMLVKLPNHLMNRKATGGYSGPSSHERTISRLAKENPAPFVAPHQYVLTKAGEEWVDPTLAEWDASMWMVYIFGFSFANWMNGVDDFRIFVGNLGPEVTDELLVSEFKKVCTLIGNLIGGVLMILGNVVSFIFEGKGYYG